MFLYQQLLTGEDNYSMVLSFAVIPAVLFEYRELTEELVRIPAEMTLLTSLFLHSGWLHLLSNMIYLWIFGDNVEDSMGHFRFLFFYLCCGLAASFTHAFMNPTSDIPLVGASGAIAGVLGAYLMLHPRVRVLVLFFYRIPLPLPAFLVIGIWVGLQFYAIYNGSLGNTAWWAHIGGFVCGVILVPLFKRSSVPLFDRGIEH
ncbi:MAG: rhomboid family intramembrane serine protease [Gammaproteobacteria bacterium]|nr:rhomboid family intramembrane serine protease [Gammaproteobacteria bacterium]